MLLGNRDESRPAEKVGQVFMNTFSFLIPSIYKPIKAKKVAKAMINATHFEQSGFQIYHYKEIMAFSEQD
jgi:hypothetical protein